MNMPKECALQESSVATVLEIVSHAVGSPVINCENDFPRVNKGKQNMQKNRFATASRNQLTLSQLVWSWWPHLVVT